MPVRSGETAPYAPPATILQLIETFRERGLAVPFTAEVLARAGVSESLIPRTLATMAGLDLIDEQGTPTEALESLRRAPKAEYRDALAAVVRGAYAEVFQFADPSKDDVERISDAFRAFKPPGQRRRMVTLFLALCDSAGLIPDGALAKPGEQRTTWATGRAKKAEKRSNGASRSSKPSTAKTPSRKNYGGMIPPAIAGLLESLPPEEEGWTKGQRDKFIATFKSVLDFVIPVADLNPPKGDEAEDTE